MTLITVVRDVCAVVGVAAPTSVFAGIGANRTLFEMLACANEMAQRIAYDAGREWTMLRATTTYSGNSVTTAFTLPANYKRMLLTSEVWRSTSAQQPMLFVSDPNEWDHRRATGAANGWGEWTIYGGQMHIFPVLSGGVGLWVNATHYTVGALVRDPVGSTLWNCVVEHTSAASGTFADDRVENPHLWVLSPTVNVPTTARFTYLDRNCIALASGGYGDHFMADDDTFRLDERLLKLGMIYNWKEHKGSPYAEDMGSFSDALAMEMGHDKPSPIIIGRGTRGRQYADYFWH